jgi:hypothetical protein
MYSTFQIIIFMYVCLPVASVIAVPFLFNAVIQINSERIPDSLFGQIILNQQCCDTLLTSLCKSGCSIGCACSIKEQANLCHPSFSWWAYQAPTAHSCLHVSSQSIRHSPTSRQAHNSVAQLWCIRCMYQTRATHSVHCHLLAIFHSSD